MKTTCFLFSFHVDKKLERNITMPYLLKRYLAFQFTPSTASNFFSFMSVAQKIGLSRPLEIWNIFGWKSILSVARGTKFCGKLNSHRFNNWWIFGVDTSNSLWVIQNQPKFIVHCRQPVVHFRHPEVQNVRLVV